MMRHYGRNATKSGTLSVPERLLLFCVASGTEPAKAGIMHRTIGAAIIKGRIKRERTLSACLPHRKALKEGYRGIRKIANTIRSDPHSSTGSASPKRMRLRLQSRQTSVQYSG